MNNYAHISLEHIIETMNGDMYFIPEIYDRFEKEYNASPLWYTEFIEQKDLGVKTNNIPTMYGKGIHTDYYKILDEQKWFLNKIKYGL